MPGQWDATVKSVYAVDSGTNNTIDVIADDKAFDVIADVEIGESLIDFGGAEYTLSVSVRNLSRFVVVATGNVIGKIPVKPGDPRKAFNKPLTVPISAPWFANAAEDGDALDVIAALKVASGRFVNTTVAISPSFIVSP
ncbi:MULTISPECIES: hypothetical protein [unclassified Frankia]